MEIKRFKVHTLSISQFESQIENDDHNIVRKFIPSCLIHHKRPCTAEIATSLEIPGVNPRIRGFIVESASSSEMSRRGS